MLPMTRSFLEAAKAINQRIGDDNKVGISLGRWRVVQAHGVLTGGCVWRCRNSKRPRMTWKTMWLRYGNAVPRQWKGVRGVTACALMRCGDRSPRQNTRWKPRTGARGAPCAARWQCCLPCPPRSCLCISLLESRRKHHREGQHWHGFRWACGVRLGSHLRHLAQLLHLCDRALHLLPADGDHGCARRSAARECHAKLRFGGRQVVGPCITQ